MPNPPLILIVEDTVEIAEIMQLMLESLGFSTHYSHTSQLALAFLEQGKPDVIVLDLGMPQISGWEFLKILRAREEWQHIPVIVMTAFDDPINRMVGKLQNVSAFLSKPVAMDRLQEEIQHILNP